MCKQIVFAIHEPAERPRETRSTKPYSLSSWKFHLGTVRDAASKCALSSRVRDLDGNSLKLIQTNACYSRRARCYGIEIRTVTITVRRANRKVPIYSLVRFNLTAIGSATSALKELGSRISWICWKRSVDNEIVLVCPTQAYCA